MWETRHSSAWVLCAKEIPDEIKAEWARKSEDPSIRSVLKINTSEVQLSLWEGSLKKNVKG